MSFAGRDGNKSTYAVVYWLLFGATQTAGMVLPRFTNFHSNAAPLLAGIVLLLPGDLIAMALPESMGSWAPAFLILIVNGTVWLIFFKILTIKPKS